MPAALKHMAPNPTKESVGIDMIHRSNTVVINTTCSFIIRTLRQET